MRKSLPLYWILLLLLLPVFLAVSISLSLLSKIQVTNQIKNGFDDKLSQIITLVDLFIDGEEYYELSKPIDQDNQVYDTNSKNYLQHVELFKSIRKNTGLSYLYTLDLIDEKRIRYILDGSEPDSFTPIGTEDKLPDGYFDIIGFTELTRRPVINEVEEWENWGLIKTGFGPIHLNDGTTEGFIGADIEVGIIEEREKHATLALIVCAVLGISVSFLVSIQITRNLATPIEKLRKLIMQLASDDTDTASNKGFEIREFNDLATEFQTFHCQTQQLEEHNTQRLDQLRQQALQVEYDNYLNKHLFSTYSSEGGRIEIKETNGFQSFSCKQVSNHLLIWHFPQPFEANNSIISAKITQLSTPSISALSMEKWESMLSDAGIKGTVNLIKIDLLNNTINYSLAHHNEIRVSENNGYRKTLFGSIELQSSSPMVLISSSLEDGSSIQINLTQVA